MQDGPDGGTLWQAVQPWVQGVVAPLGVALGWLIRWNWVTARQRRHDEEEQRQRDDDYRLRDRQLLSSEQAAAFHRLSQERDKLASELAIAVGEMNRAWRIAYAVYDFARNQRTDANAIMTEMCLAWSAGGDAPKKPPSLIALPDITSFGLDH